MNAKNMADVILSNCTSERGKRDITRSRLHINRSRLKLNLYSYHLRSNSNFFLKTMRTLVFLCLLCILQTEARRGSSNRRRSRGSRRRPVPENRQINHEYFNCVANFLCPDDVSLDTCRHEAVRTCSAKY